mgnify:CR=1 FL=1
MCWPIDVMRDHPCRKDSLKGDCSICMENLMQDKISKLEKEVEA